MARSRATFDFTELAVFLSSRVEQPLDPGKSGSPTLGQVREQLQEEVQREKLFGEQVVKMDLNEPWPALSGDKSVWDHCVERVGEADVVLVLYTGSSGWREDYGSIGICHAELQAAMRTAPQKVRALELPLATTPTDEGQREADAAFREYWDRLRVPAKPVKSKKAALDESKRAIREALTSLAHAGARRPSGHEVGSVLEWSRMDFSTRAKAMRAELRKGFGGSGDPPRGPGDAELVAYEFQPGLEDVLVCCHAVPAAMTVAAAREMVGQPFLRDHELADELGEETVGPVHVLACARGVTESQAVRQLGFPDATIVRESFGVYVADDVQKIQLIMLRDCRDPSSTQGALDELKRWLRASEEGERLVNRARARTAIVTTIHEHAGT